MHSSLKGWQILFLIEGAFTIAFAILTGLMLPRSTDTASFLSDREKQIARLRVLRDGSSASGTKFNSKSFFKPLSDWRYYVFAGIALCYGVAASVSPNSRSLNFWDILRSNRLAGGLEFSDPNHRAIRIQHCQNQPLHRSTLCVRHARHVDYRLLLGSIS